MYNEKGYYWYHSRYTVDSRGSSIPVMAAINNIFVCCAHHGIWSIMTIYRIRPNYYNSDIFVIDEKRVNGYWPFRTTSWDRIAGQFTTREQAREAIRDISRKEHWKRIEYVYTGKDDQY